MNIIAATILGIIIIVLVILCNTYPNEKHTPNFTCGVFVGIILAIVTVFEVIVVTDIIEKPKPTPMDVYQGKTTLEYTIRDSIKVDSVVVFKENYDEK